MGSEVGQYGHKNHNDAEQNELCCDIQRNGCLAVKEKKIAKIGL